MARVMLQPTKSHLREILSRAADENVRLKGEVDRLAAMLEGEWKAFAGGVIVGVFAMAVSWWLS